jgi:hypothetical protein
MATIFSANEGVSVVKVVTRPSVSSTVVLMSDGTARHCGFCRSAYLPTPIPPPLPEGVKYVDIDAKDRNSSQDGYYSAILSDGSAIHWSLDQCWGAGRKSPDHNGRPTMPISSWYDRAGVRHLDTKAIAGNGGFYKRTSDSENYRWFPCRSPVKEFGCDLGGNLVTLLEDDSLHMEGSDLLKCIDEGWRWSRIIPVREGENDAVCIVGVTKSGMAMQLTDSSLNFPAKECRDQGMILPVPGAEVVSIECIRDAVETHEDGTTKMRGSRRAYRTNLCKPPTQSHPEGEKVMVAHLAPNTHRAASRAPNIPGMGREDGLKTINYNVIVSGEKDEEWVQMMVEAASNDPRIIPWLPGSLRKHPRMRGLQGLLKL